MRGLGLLVDGPAIWGGAVRSRGPGVFVVELPGGLDAAPIDPMVLRRWIERMPGMLVDGEPATLETLAARLRAFWLPREPILYVGRSAKSLGARIAAMHATPLGDARPYAGGHWLRTLSALPSLRIWWSETDAFEEYEDALVSEVAARTPPEVAAALPDPTVVLPFANLASPAGTPKRHGLEGSLRDAPEAAPQPPGRAKPAVARRSSGSVTRRPVAPREKRTPPRPAPTFVSQDGLDRLHAEVDELRNQVRPGVIERVKTARELGDLRENAEYESARKEQSFVEGRIQTLEALIKGSVVVEAPAPAGASGIGSTLVVESDGQEEVFVLVGSSEADPSAGRISYSSPVGQALLHRTAGEEVTVRLPGGEVRYVIREVR
jgi:transcription elongation factor GreA